MGMGKMEEKLKMRGLNLYYNMDLLKKVVLRSCGGWLCMYCMCGLNVFLLCREFVTEIS